MADDFREVPSEIDILLGADIFPEILLDGLVKGPAGLLADLLPNSILQSLRFQQLIHSLYM